MDLFIKILSGPKSGQIIPLVDGMRFGRKEGDVIIKDSSMSSVHAEIFENQVGEFVLKDLDSVNKIEVQGEKLERLPLNLGTEFKLGNTGMLVVDKAEETLGKTLAEKFEKGAGLSGPAKTRVHLSAKDFSWKEVLSKDVGKLVAASTGPVPGFSPFRRVLRLDFLQGVQSEKVILLGYGPRYFGSDTLDIELQDPTAPPQAFEILPDGLEARFINRDPSTVKLSNRSVSSELLKNGDRITFGQTIIEVTFL